MVTSKNGRTIIYMLDNWFYDDTKQLVNTTHFTCTHCKKYKKKRRISWFNNLLKRAIQPMFHFNNGYDGVLCKKCQGKF